MADNKEIATNEQLNTELFNDACVIIDQARDTAYSQVNEILIKRNRLLGMRINIDILQTQRAEYGKQIVLSLAAQHMI